MVRAVLISSKKLSALMVPDVEIEDVGIVAAAAVMIT